MKRKIGWMAAAGAAAVLIGCGGGNESREAEIEKEAAKHGVDADVTVDDKGDVKTVEITRGNQKVGNNLNLPDGFPDDVPVDPDWNIIHTTPSPGGFMVQAMASGDADAVLAGARDAMLAAGWTEKETEPGAGPMTRAGFEKDDRMTTINIIDGGGPQLSVQILTMKTPG